MRSIVLFDFAFGVSIFLAAAAADARERVSFPPGFRWCVATAAHQIEGGNANSDLWDWEQIPGRIRNGDRSGAACDHWNRVDQDIGLMRELGVDTYRFSVEWAKIEPSEGVYDETAIAHYRTEVEKLRSAGIAPLITLHHFTFPRWLRAKGGWEWDRADAAFEAYSRLVYTRVAPGTRDWVTINEPMVHAIGGYVAGLMPPGETRPIRGLVPVVAGMLKAHARAYHALHELAGEARVPVRVGLAHHLRTFDPASRWNPLDRLAARLSDQAWNWAFIDAAVTGRLKLRVLWLVNADLRIPGLENTQDFLGINYYTGDKVAFSVTQGLVLKQRPELPKNDLGWDIFPAGFYRVLKTASRRYPHLSILITENGTADAADRFRPAYLKDHLREVARAIDSGARIEGYCHWSLMDNFEWHEGFFPRFGLYEMNYATQERRPRASAKLFSTIARENGFETE